MHDLHALIQGQLAPQYISLKKLIDLAQQYPNVDSVEYHIIDRASNLLLAYYIEQSQSYL